jgi:hypothetical protein
VKVLILECAEEQVEPMEQKVKAIERRAMEVDSSLRQTVAAKAIQDTALTAEDPLLQSVFLWCCTGVGIVLAMAFNRVLWRFTLDIFCLSLNIQRFLLDYSLSLRNGCRQVYPDSSFQNCFPHIDGYVDGSWRGKFAAWSRNAIMGHISI